MKKINCPTISNKKFIDLSSFFFHNVINHTHLLYLKTDIYDQLVRYAGKFFLTKINYTGLRILDNLIKNTDLQYNYFLNTQ